MRNTRQWLRLAAVAGGLAIVLVALAASGAFAKAKADNPYHLKNPGTLEVGMNLQYKPQMYLDAKGKPAGYDVILLNALAKELNVKLKIDNLDFNGLIPGLVSKKFDMVSVGLSATPERKKAVSFSRAYVPYAQILAVRVNDTTPATIDAWNDSRRSSRWQPVEPMPSSSRTTSSPSSTNPTRAS